MKYLELKQFIKFLCRFWSITFCKHNTEGHPRSLTLIINLFFRLSLPRFRSYILFLSMILTGILFNIQWTQWFDTYFFVYIHICTPVQSWKRIDKRKTKKKVQQKETRKLQTIIKTPGYKRINKLYDIVTFDEKKKTKKNITLCVCDIQICELPSIYPTHRVFDTLTF